MSDPNEWLEQMPSPGTRSGDMIAEWQKKKIKNKKALENFLAGSDKTPIPDEDIPTRPLEEWEQAEIINKHYVFTKEMSPIKRGQATALFNFLNQSIPPGDTENNNIPWKPSLDLDLIPYMTKKQYATWVEIANQLYAQKNKKL